MAVYDVGRYSLYAAQAQLAHHRVAHGIDLLRGQRIDGTSITAAEHDLPEVVRCQQPMRAAHVSKIRRITDAITATNGRPARKVWNDA